MRNTPTVKFMTRREMLRISAIMAGGAPAAHFYPAALDRAAAAAGHPQQGPAGDQVAAMRAQFGGTPIQAQKLSGNLTMFSGPGGNVAVLNGSDGKLIGDTFVQPAWTHLTEALGTSAKRLSRRSSTRTGISITPTTTRRCAPRAHW